MRIHGLIRVPRVPKVNGQRRDHMMQCNESLESNSWLPLRAVLAATFKKYPFRL